MLGGTFGHYRVVDKLGAGGMGEVYRVRDSRLERDVALKVLPAASFADAAARARLLREARSAAGLNHPNICTVYEVGEAEGQAYIAMELVEGEPLSARLARGPLPPAETARLALQLADALAHAHERGVVHRDLKSANVVVAADGRARVLDFGLAKRVLAGGDDEPTLSHVTLTQPGTVMGTLAYMAPEQLRGLPADMRSDIWALGVVLYEMATGARPFLGHTGFEVSSAVLSQAPKPLPAHVPPTLRGVIDRCLEKEPARRYQRAGEVRAALETLSGSAPEAPAGWRTGIARRAVLGVAAALLVAALVGSARFLSERKGGAPGAVAQPKISSLLVLPFANLSGDPAQEFFADGMTDALISELSQVTGLDVVSRTSAMQYKGTRKPLAEIVRELGVEGVIEGGVLREGDQVRVTISLVGADSGRALWSQSFDREASGLLSLYGEVVRAIASEVQVTLSPQEQARLARSRSVNPEAYEAYLKGRMHWYKQTPQDVDRALQYFRFAQEKDPGFALSMLGMGYIWTYYASAGLAPPGEMRDKVVAALRSAREIDPTLAESYEGEGDYKFYYEWNWEGAGRDYRRAIELKPHSAEMRGFYWEFLVAMNRLPEAEAQIRRYMELDPYNSYVQMAYGLFLLSSRRFDDAVLQFDKLLKADMDFGPAYLGLWQAHHHEGRHEQALAAARDYFTKWGDEEMAAALDAGFAIGGYRGAMRAAADRLVKRSRSSYVLAIQVAGLYAYAGDATRTLDWLEKAHEARETGLVKLQVDPDWDLVRGQPRFQALLRKMAFPAARTETG
jgi:TolB-like protein/Tfp pilus assembly protein PilF